jgi:tRNA(adenine34) deaminase
VKPRASEAVANKERRQRENESAPAHQMFMSEALDEARKSLALDEFPVGAVLVLRDEVLVRGHWAGPNGRLLDHAEMLVLLQAERDLRVVNRSDRQEAVLYTSLEPCVLCMAAAMTFILGTVVYALDAPVDGATNLPDLWSPQDGHPPNAMPYGVPKTIAGVKREESRTLIEEWMRRDPNRSWAASYVAPRDEGCSDPDARPLQGAR